jgi:tocopherol O-methyltransferase
MMNPIVDEAAIRANAVAYYSECWTPRFRRGHNAKSHAMHYGMHDLPELDADTAKLRLNAHVAMRLGVSPDQPASFVDLGCGVGGTVIDLAQRHPEWSFCGVDLTPPSLAFANENALEANVGGRVRFVLADYADSRLSESFDGAYAIESACHAADRPRLVREMFRLLKPGASALVVDLFRTARPLDPASEQSYDQLKRGFAIVDYYDADLVQQFRTAGFSDVHSLELTEQMRAGTERSAHRARVAMSDGPHSERMRWHFEACVAVDQLCASDHLAYRSVRATRAR